MRKATSRYHEIMVRMGFGEESTASRTRPESRKLSPPTQQVYSGVLKAMRAATRSFAKGVTHSDPLIKSLNRDKNIRLPRISNVFGRLRATCSAIVGLNWFPSRKVHAHLTATLNEGELHKRIKARSAEPRYRGNLYLSFLCFSISIMTI
jgi:hypothetical protein